MLVIKQASCWITSFKFVLCYDAIILLAFPNLTKILETFCPLAALICIHHYHYIIEIVHNIIGRGWVPYTPYTMYKSTEISKLVYYRITPYSIDE